MSLRSWLAARLKEDEPMLVGPPEELTVPPGCPGLNCGWRDPISVALLSRAVYSSRGPVMTTQTGRLCRCPICQTLYVELADKVQRCGAEPAPPAEPKDVRPEARRPAYPSVPDDMPGFFTREPR